MSVDIINNLGHHLLVAMPSIKDEPFTGAVMFIHEYDDEGAMAFITNKPMPITMGDILRQLNIELKDNKANEIHLLQGGPVSTEQLYIVQYNKEQKKDDSMALIQPQDLLQSFAEGEGLTNILPFLGYAGWHKGQLEKEIRNNDWLVCPPSKEILYEVPAKERYQACLDKLGIDLTFLNERGGRA